MRLYQRRYISEWQKQIRVVIDSYRHKAKGILSEMHETDVPLQVTYMALMGG